MRAQTTTKRKRYGAVDPAISIEMIVYWIIGNGIALGCSIFFFIHFVLQGDPSGWILIAISVLPFIILNVYLIRKSFWNRYLLFYSFEDDGIHCSGLGWGRFTVPWISIRCYGFVDASYMMTSYRIVFFSQDIKEIQPKTREELLLTRKDRLIMQYRENIYEAAKKHMPADIKRNLEDCFRHNRGGFFRR